MIKYIAIFRLVLRCLLVARKEISTVFSTGLTGRLKNLDPAGNPTGQSTRPVSISGPRSFWGPQNNFLGPRSTFQKKNQNGAPEEKTLYKIRFSGNLSFQNKLQTQFALKPYSSGS